MAHFIHHYQNVDTNAAFGQPDLTLQERLLGQAQDNEEPPHLAAAAAIHQLSPIEMTKVTLTIDVPSTALVKIGGPHGLPNLIGGAFSGISTRPSVSVRLLSSETYPREIQQLPQDFVFIQEDPSSPSFDSTGTATLANLQGTLAAPVPSIKPKISKEGSLEITRAILRFLFELAPDQRTTVIIRDVELGIRGWLSEEVNRHYYETLTGLNADSRSLHGYITDRVRDLKLWGYIHGDNSLTEQGRAEHHQPTRFAPLRASALPNLQ